MMMSPESHMAHHAQAFTGESGRNPADGVCDSGVSAFPSLSTTAGAVASACLDPAYRVGVEEERDKHVDRPARTRYTGARGRSYGRFGRGVLACYEIGKDGFASRVPAAMPYRGADSSALYLYVVFPYAC